MIKTVFFLCFSLSAALALITACGHNPVSPLGFTPTPTMNTSTPTNTATNTPTSTSTNTPGPTGTSTNSPTVTDTQTATNTATITSTHTATNTATNTAAGPTNTYTNTATNSNTNTATNTPTITNTYTATNSSTNTPTSTATNTPTNTFIPSTPDAISQSTETPTMTHTSPTTTPVLIMTDTPNATVTATPTSTPYSTSSWSLFAQLAGSSGGSSSGIAIGADRIIVSDNANNDVQVFDNNGNLLYTFFLNSGGQLTGGIAMDQLGEVYLCDSTNAQVEGFILSSSAATYDYTWSGQSTLTNPNDVKIDPNGNLVVADNSGIVYNLAWTDDTVLNQTLPNSYAFDGVALDPSGNIYASDQTGSQIVEFDYAFNNLNTPFTGSTGTNWPTLTPNLNTPVGITVDSQNNLWIADSGNARVVQATTQGIYLGEIDGFSQPAYLTFDSIGSLFVTDQTANMIYQYLFN